MPALGLAAVVAVERIGNQVGVEDRNRTHAVGLRLEIEVFPRKRQVHVVDRFGVDPADGHAVTVVDYSVAVHVDVFHVAGLLGERCRIVAADDRVVVVDVALGQQTVGHIAVILGDGAPLLVDTVSGDDFAVDYPRQFRLGIRIAGVEADTRVFVEVVIVARADLEPVDLGVTGVLERVEQRRTERRGGVDNQVGSLLAEDVHCEVQLVVEETQVETGVPNRDDLPCEVGVSVDGLVAAAAYQTLVFVGVDVIVAQLAVGQA